MHPFPSSEETFRYVSKDTMSINLTNISLHTYLGKELLVLETTEVEAAYESQTDFFPLLLSKVKVPAFLATIGWSMFV